MRPPMSTHCEKTGVASVLSPESGEKAHKIGRADLAALMVQHLEAGYMCVNRDGDDHIARPGLGPASFLCQGNPIGCVKACNNSFTDTWELTELAECCSQVTVSGVHPRAQLCSRKDIYYVKLPTPLEEVIHHNVIKNNKTGGRRLMSGK